MLTSVPHQKNAIIQCVLVWRLKLETNRGKFTLCPRVRLLFVMTVLKTLSYSSKERTKCHSSQEKKKKKKDNSFYFAIRTETSGIGSDAEK